RPPPDDPPRDSPPVAPHPEDPVEREQPARRRGIGCTHPLMVQDSSHRRVLLRHLHTAISLRAGCAEGQITGVGGIPFPIPPAPLPSHPRLPTCTPTGPTMTDHELRFATRATHAAQAPAPTTGAIMPPAYQTSTYVQEGLGRPRAGHAYARGTSRTPSAREANIAALESGRHGIAFASGLAALEAIVKRLSAGDHVGSEENTYGGTTR